MTFILPDEYQGPESFNVVLYGKAGTGKSTAAATAPGPILWINAEGPGAIAFPRQVAKERDTEVLEARINRGQSPGPILKQVLDHLRSGDEPICQTVVIDSYAKVREGLASDKVRQASKDSRKQWGEVNDVLKYFYGTVHELSINVVTIAHEEVKDLDGSAWVKPLLGGATGDKLPGDVDVVAYCSPELAPDGTVARWMARVVADSVREAKFRGNAIGPYVELDLTEWLRSYRDGLAGVPAEEHGSWDDAFTEPQS